MKIGFGKVDVTPRVGVPLCGFETPDLEREAAEIRSLKTQWLSVE